MKPKRRTRDDEFYGRVYVGTTLDEQTHSQLKHAAVELHQTQGDLIKAAIVAWLDRRTLDTLDGRRR